MICEVCGNDLMASWSDFHGEAECIHCGAPHQMKDYHGAPEDEEYPYIKLNKDFIPIFRAYWTTFNRRCRLGMYMGQPPEVGKQIKHLKNWLQATHPKWMAEG